MLQISRRADYAVRVMLELGALSPGERLATGRLAHHTGVPKAFLHKITSSLVQAGLLHTYTGAKGGLALARPAAEISLLHILEAAEGPVCLNICLVEEGQCARAGVCPPYLFWGRLQGLILIELGRARLDELVAEAQAMAHGVQSQQATFLMPAFSQAETVVAGDN